MRNVVELWNTLDEAVRRLEETWAATPDPGFESLVPSPDDPLRQRVLVELVKVDQEYSWRSGGCRTVEAYLAQWPELGRADTVVELLNAECLTRATLAKLAKPDELRSRFPAEIAARIDLAAIQADAEKERRGEDIAPASNGDTSASRMDCTPAKGPKQRRLQTGQRFGRYEIRGLLGEGGMGAVYQAYDTRLRREVALKIPRLDPTVEPEVLQRFLREAPAAAAVRHPNVCPVYDAGEIDGTLYITMARIEGQSLTQWAADRPVAPVEAAKLVEKLARALAAVHAAGMVHRDIKPSNVMIDPNGEPFLTDFGLARLDGGEEGDSPHLPERPDGCCAQMGTVPFFSEQSRLTGAGNLLGTVPYMSPEQTYGRRVDAASDIYSLGTLFYQLLTGRRPFDVDPSELVDAIRHQEPPRPSSLCADLDAKLEAICLRAMSKDPNARYPSAEQLADAIRQWLQTATGKGRPPRRHRRAIWLVGAAAALIALLGVIVELKIDRGVTLPISRWINASPRASAARVSSDGETLYVAYSEYPQPSRIQAFDIASGRLLQTIASTDEKDDHKGLALSGDNRYLYVTNFFRRAISRFDLRSANRRMDLLIGGVPEAVWATRIGITPDRRKLAVTVGADGRTVDMNNDQISIVDVADGRFSLAGEVRLDDEPISQVVFSADSRFGYVVTKKWKSAGPTLYEIRMTPPFEVTRRLSFPESVLVDAAVCDRLGRIFVSDSYRRAIKVVDLNTFELLCDLKLQGYGPGPLAANDRGDVLCVICPEGRKLFLLNPDDGAIKAQVDGLREGAAGAELAPDGRRLFVWHGGAAGGVAVVDISSPLRRQRGGVVFASNWAGEGYQICRIPPGKNEAVRLTHNHATDRCPRFSPDGWRIAYLSTAPGKPRVCVTDSRGSEPTVLIRTDPAMDGCPGMFDWSPDGTEIAFIGGDGHAIRIVNVGSGEIRSVVDGELSDGYARHLTVCWRKNDGLILATSQTPASAHHQGTFLVNPNTGWVTRLMRSDGKSDFLASPVSSPDGKRIAAILARPDDLPCKKIYLADPNGSNSKCLVDVGLDGNLNLALRWSPDGRYLAFSAVRDNRSHVFLVDVAAADRKPIQITDGDYNDIEPDLFGDPPPGLETKPQPTAGGK
jgi:serine/threonine protein kinase/Tol biopolymer transport system component